MEKFIHSYLTKHYEINNTENTSKSIRLISFDAIFAKNDTSKHKDVYFGKKLIKELKDIFLVNEVDAKAYIEKWAGIQKKDIDLHFYWLQKENENGYVFAPFLPAIHVETIKAGEYAPKKVKSRYGAINLELSELIRTFVK